MKNKHLWLLICSALLTAGACAQSAPSHFDGKTWWGFVSVLADDKMEGRETGSAGLRKAEAYIVDQLKADGMEPAGSNGFYQPAKFESRQIVEKDSSLALLRDGKAEPLTLGDDAVFSTRIDLAPSVTAPLAFAGYGLSVPEMNYDDLAGLDLKGKVAVILAGSPAEIPGALSSHYQSVGERWKVFEKAGAVGTITVLNPTSMDIPWARISLNRTHPNMALIGQEFDETAGQKLALIFNPAKAEQLFAGSGHTLQEVLDAAQERKPLPRFPLTMKVRAKATVKKKKVESANVVAKLPGSDPKLKNEY